MPADLAGLVLAQGGALLLVLLRCTVLVWVAFQAANLPVPGSVRSALAIGLAMVAAAAAPLPTIPLEPLPMALAALSEIVAAVALGALVAAFVGFFAVAAGFIALFSGLSAIAYPDNALSGDNALGRLLAVAMLAAFAAADGLTWMAQGIVASVHLVPPGTLPVVPSVPMVLDAIGRMLRAALQVAFPFMLLSVVLPVVAGLMSRAAPALQFLQQVAGPQLVASMLLLALLLAADPQAWSRAMLAMLSPDGP